MEETPDSGVGSTSKCSDTTDASIPNTSEEIPKASSKSARTTRSKRPVSDMRAYSARSEEPPPRYLFSELGRLTYKIEEDGPPFRADDLAHSFSWRLFVSRWADVKGDVDWDDLEERAHFLNMLYEWCEGQGIPFPLEDTQAENFNERFNAR